MRGPAVPRVLGALCALAVCLTLGAEAAQAQAESEVAAAVRDSASRQGRARPLLVDETYEVGLANDRVALLVGRAGARAGRFRLWDAARSRWLLPEASAAVNLAHFGRVSLAEASDGGASAPYQIESFFDPGLGGGYRLEVDFPGAATGETLTLRAWLANGRSYVLLQLGVKGVTAPTYQVEPGFEYLTLETSRLDQGSDALTAYGQGTAFFVEPLALDGGEHKVEVVQGTPLLVAGRRVAGGLIAAVLDWCEGPMRFSCVGGRGAMPAGLQAWDTGPSYSRGTTIWSPRLMLQVAQASAPAWAFEEYKQLMARLYPPAPTPDWVRYQWDSWYPYGVRVTETALRRQVDYIASHLSDLGPWHVVADLGWFLGGDDPRAGWATADPGKFPKGLRALTDAAHARGVRVVVTLSLPVVYGAGRRAGLDWLSLPRLISENSGWFVPLGEGRYACNFEDAGFLRYFQESVVARLFREFNVDGVKLEGLAGGRLEMLDRETRLRQGVTWGSASQTLAIYESLHQAATAAKASCYLEGGWANPPAAAPLAHCFRNGEERAAFSSAYPRWGLVEHIDEAVGQVAILGQRAHLGLVYEPPGTSTVNREWLCAAAALGAMVGLSFDLPQLSSEALADYRGLLSALRPFEGSLRVQDGKLPAEVFGNFRDEAGYVVALNRGTEPVDRLVDLPGVMGRAVEAACVYDVQAGRFVLTRGGLTLRLAPQSLRLLIVRTRPGLMWTTSATKVLEGNRGLAVWAWGPPDVPGVVRLYCPALRSVVVDGRELFAGGIPEAWQGRLSYDYTTGVLTIRYAHKGRQRFNIGLQPAPR